jgi:DNA-binding NarL/FixJ family response regulator
MPVAGHSGAHVGLQKEVTSRHPCRIASSSELAPSLETLVRKLVALASNEPGAYADGSNCGKEQVIFDVEIDGVRCLLTRLEKSPTSRISFSPRESEIARMVAKGYPNKTIAAVLEISSWTVCTHLRRMFAKLGVSSRAAMVARMMDAGMLMHTDDFRKMSQTL